MRKLRILLGEVVGLGLLIGWLMWKYPELVDDIIPWVALGIACHLTYDYILDAPVFRRWACGFGKKAKPMIAWPLVFLLGGGVSLGYWKGIDRSLRRLSAIAETHAAAKRSKLALETKSDNVEKPKEAPANPLEVPKPTAEQMEAIKELDNFIVGRDEAALRQVFRFRDMMVRNIEMTRDRIALLKSTGQTDFHIQPYEFAGGQLFGNIQGGDVKPKLVPGVMAHFTFPADRVSVIVQPKEYVDARATLLRFETSSELPSSIIAPVKDFDAAVGRNADNLLKVLDDALKESPNFYLRYDDDTSPYFHQIEVRYMGKFIHLRPKADKIRDAIRSNLGVE